MKSVYIHIPFCETICSYCDFPKVCYHKKWINKYLDELEKEIRQNYNNEIINTIYIGGGTPSVLSINEINKLLDILKIFNKNNNVEITFECNIENTTEEKIKLLYENGINRLSFGVQTFNPLYLKLLNRNHNFEEVKKIIDISKKIGFKNINIDLIYALPNQTLEELKIDLNLFLSLDINHISTYSLIIEDNTKIKIDGIKEIDDELDYEMYKLICNTLKQNNFIHYEISNFSKKGYESKHNLVYWNNSEYYGFGMGASGFINNIRYTNTRSLNKYINGNYKLEEEKMDIHTNLENAFILGLRKIEGINKREFYNNYNININDIIIVRNLLEEGKLIDDGNNIYINSKYIYLSNDILINFIGEV